MNEETMKFIIEGILENLSDVLELERKDDFNDGKRLAYYEVLLSIKNQLEINDFDPKEFGIDFELESIL